LNNKYDTNYFAKIIGNNEEKKDESVVDEFQKELERDCIGKE
jgi:hypothetical protein